MACFGNFYSQTRQVAARKKAGLHPINEMRRFRMLCSSLFCSVCVSLVYAFDLFTKEFSDNFGLSAGDQSTISTVGVVFCYFALPYGILFNYVGPTSLFAIALVTALIGCLGLALVFGGTITGNTATIAVFYAFMNTASGLLDSAATMTLVEAFPRNRGPVMGLSKVMTGLGSSVLSSVSSNIFTNNVTGFIYFIMAICIAACLLAMVLIELPPYFMNWWRRRGKTIEEITALESLKPLYHSKHVPKRRLALGYILVACTLVFFTVSTPVTAYTVVSTASRRVLGAITLILCVSFISIALPIRWLGGVDEPTPEGYDAQTNMSDEVAVSTALRDKEEPVEAASTQSESSIGGELVCGANDDNGNAAVMAPKNLVYDFEESTPQDPRYGGTLVDNLLRPDIWLILFAFLFHGAIGTMVMYNASTIYVARTGENRSKQLSALYTAFLGVGSAVGRVAMGLFEAYVQHQDPNKRFRLLVTVALPLSPIIGMIGSILILVLPGKALLFPYLLVYFEEGFFNGARALLFPCIFQGHHAIFYNMSFLSTVVCAVCFNRLLFGMTVDSQRDKFNNLNNTKSMECTVKACVQTPLIVSTCLAAVAAVLLTIVHIRYSCFVRKNCKGGLDDNASHEEVLEPMEPITTA